MVRAAINILSPIAALAVVWVSLQSVAVDEPQPDSPPAIAPTAQAPALLPELASVSRLIGTGRTEADTVPHSVKRLLLERGAVLLIPEAAAAGSGL